LLRKMEKGKRIFVYGVVFRSTKKGDIVGDRVTSFYCKNCGYIEFYRQRKESNFNPKPKPGANKKLAYLIYKGT
jgi:predicted nucleic-acid-binding Zn-ribbon protein